jgi:PTH2 family peptidyl-tRNA hydrolase
MRADLGMSIGKMCAQASHASMSFLTRNLTICPPPADCVTGKPMWPASWELDIDSVFDAEDIANWLENGFTKVVLFVDSLEELDRIQSIAIDSGLMCHAITDNGKTEFDGVPTRTCIAIGPHELGDFIGITDTLRSTLEKPNEQIQIQNT